MSNETTGQVLRDDIGPLHDRRTQPDQHERDLCPRQREQEP